MIGKNYDPACYDLAARFLSDWPDKNTEANRDQLAALIQRTIEDDIEYGMTAPVRFPGPIERWRVCPSTHCERWQECRSPHDCSGTGKNLTTEQRAALSPVVLLQQRGRE